MLREDMRPLKKYQKSIYENGMSAISVGMKQKIFINIYDKEKLKCIAIIVEQN